MRAEQIVNGEGARIGPFELLTGALDGAAIAVRECAES